MCESKLISKLSGCFHRPFNGLPILVWCFFVWCFFIQRKAPIWHGSLFDSDDYMHLLRARDLLEGQGWFDLFFHRLSPPEGVLSHFSRLIDAPLAALIWPFHTLGLDWQISSYIAAVLWPMMLLAVFLGVIVWCARSFVKEEWTRYACFVALFAPLVTLQFSLGRTDHHNVAMICTLLSMGSLLRLFDNKESVKWALLSGFFPALGMAVALETLPWLMLLSVAVGLLCCFEGKTFLKATWLYVLSLFSSTALLLLITTGPQAFTSHNPLLFSGLYLLLVGVISLALFIASLSVLVFRFDGRFLVHTVLGLAAIFGFLYFFPALKDGPYGQVDPEISKKLLGAIGEARPLYVFNETASVLSTLVFPYIAFILGCFLAFLAKGKERRNWIFLVSLVFVSIFLAIAYQARVRLYAELFSILIYVGAMAKLLPMVRKEYKGRKLFWIELYLVLFLGPLSGVYVSAFMENKPALDSLVLFPVRSGYEKASCTGPGLWSVLNLESTYGSRPRLIINMANEGAGILFKTKHNVLSAPYHTNVKGNLDAIHFFTATNPQDAFDIAKRNKADLVLMCENMSYLYKSKKKKTLVKQGEKGKKVSDNPTFAEQLLEGDVPAWLKPVELPFFGEARLYEVHLKGEL